MASRLLAQGLDDEAGMLVLLALGAMHWLMQKWVGSNFALDRTELLERTSELIRRVVAGIPPQ
ncbi:hypothetical protein [Paeniglutamicibacter cryotolerans]|uniref:Uncharacterized protein n=1 Tax=Paeniglutamicibacter cryotolerans TaxID=670079 RepID=A0A839QIG1_9MICC|nr:hypothetical protein [Paeniglutamicibacter cryotolerans]MBB2994315.1 hypothetical protein [Paeniglutamicibacter cryotolerans]